jgi:hypothetical protein
VSHVLGGHIEKNRAGELLAWQSTAHADEHVLQLDQSDVQALPGALREFNGFYSKTGSLIIENLIHLLEAFAGAAALVLLLLGTLGYRWYRARRVKVRRRCLTRPEVRRIIPGNFPRPSTGTMETACRTEDHR